MSQNKHREICMSFFNSMCLVSLEIPPIFGVIVFKTHRVAPTPLPPLDIITQLHKQGGRGKFLQTNLLETGASL